MHAFDTTITYEFEYSHNSNDYASTDEDGGGLATIAIDVEVHIDDEGVWTLINRDTDEDVSELSFNPAVFKQIEDRIAEWIADNKAEASIARGDYV